MLLVGKRAELENTAIRMYAEGDDIPQISTAIGVSENSLRKWKQRAGREWEDARAACRKSYIGSFEEVGARLRRSREITSQLTGDLQSQGQMGLILNETIRTMLYDLFGQVQTAGIDAEKMGATIDQLKGLALTLQRTEAAANLNVKREAEIRKQALSDGADAVEKAAIQKGMNAEEAAFWRGQVLGVQ
ncbi:MAG: phage protein Gp27 family protein [Pseudomonadota bacterium]